MKSLISIVAPAYNEEDVIEKFYLRITKILSALSEYNYEICIVNDGSEDNTVKICHRLLDNDPHISFLSLSRNFGHEIAVAAGLDYAKGDIIILMDIDLQDPPEIIPQMIDKYEEGYDIVNAKRKSREGETWLKKFTAEMFYKVFSASSGKVRMPKNVGNFRLISRRVVNAFKELRETHRFARGLFCWVGFPTIEIEFEREARAAGKTKYNYKTMINYAIEGLTSFTTAPLRWAAYIGIITAIFAILYMIYVFWMAITKDPNLQKGWSSMMIVLLFFGSLQMIFLGIIGEYLGRIFDETKNRPLYYIEEYTTKIN
ncbi:glycosyltransferase [Holdemania sp. 1001302B_160321_E10]|uniref:glycosyltransferase n=1 Tax=Holdemania sp. 1001302B_160321_E10 TaxID=2787120 RepID=UPI001896BA88|nr:glycosyltransferase family 2 protein [Holdemania sp. 1001302B_160321_E10]